MTPPRVLFAHERRGVARAVARVLTREGFAFEHVADGVAAESRLRDERFDALVIDVGLSGTAGYALVERAKAMGPDAGAQVVVLVASVYRRTSYKRRPSRLYGADDYVEIHHLCDSLPRKLREHLALPAVTEDAPRAPHVRESSARVKAREALRVEGDSRLAELHADHRRLATLIVADMVLYNGAAIGAAATLKDAATAVRPDLDVARELYRQVVLAEGGDDDQGAIDAAFAELMRSLGREGPA